MNPEIVRLQSVVDELLTHREAIKVLEAGCGSGSHISLGPNTYTVGLDISDKQLDRNSLLNEKILGDVQRYRLPRSDFDVIICWDVLEHLPQPEKAIQNFVRAVKTDGIIILAMPNLLSFKGLVTKLTPYRFHVWIWRYVYGNKLAGKDDNGPFHTFLRWSLAPTSMKRFARENGLSVMHFSAYEAPLHSSLRAKYGLTGAKWKLVDYVVKLLTFGKVSANLTDYIIVLKKQQTARSGLRIPQAQRSAFASVLQPVQDR